MFVVLVHLVATVLQQIIWDILSNETKKQKKQMEIIAADKIIKLI